MHCTYILTAYRYILLGFKLCFLSKQQQEYKQDFFYWWKSCENSVHLVLGIHENHVVNILITDLWFVAFYESPRFFPMQMMRSWKEFNHELLTLCDGFFSTYPKRFGWLGLLAEYYSVNKLWGGFGSTFKGQ